MPESGKADRWNSLLETLGVPVTEPTRASETAADVAETESTPTAAARPQPLSMLPPEKPKPAAKPKPAPPAAKSPSYWSRIAGALGLEVPQPAAEEAPRPIPPAEEPPRRRSEEPPAAAPERDFEPAARTTESAPRMFEP